MSQASESGRRQIDLARTKETLSIIREIAFILFVILIFLWPSLISRSMSRAGIASAFGIEFENEVKATVDTIDSNQNNAERQLAAMKDLSEH